MSNSFTEKMGYVSPFGTNSLFNKADFEEIEPTILAEIENNDSISQTLVTGKNNSANGYYYLYDGTYLGNYGTSVEVVVCNKKSDKEDKTTKQKWQEFLLPMRLSIQNKDFLHFAASIFGESVMGYGVVIKKEVYAFATTIGNYKDKIKMDENRDLNYREAIKENGVYAAGGNNYINFINEKDRNSNTNMKLAIAGVINEITNGFDYSYGATCWDGIDIKTAKWAKGLKFTQKTDDIFGLGDNLIEGKEYWKYANGKDVDKYIRRKWDSKYITTIAYSGENRKRKNGKYPYFKDDKQNMYKYGTTFMKINPNYETEIPSKTQTD